MFDIGFSELVMLALVALLVVGPERLPGLIRTVGLWIRKAKRFAHGVQMEINREIAAEELRKTLEDRVVGETGLKDLGQEMRDLQEEVSRYHPDQMMKSLWPGQEKPLAGDSLQPSTTTVKPDDRPL